MRSKSSAFLFDGEGGGLSTDQRLPIELSVQKLKTEALELINSRPSAVSFRLFLALSLRFVTLAFFCYFSVETLKLPALGRCLADEEDVCLLVPPSPESANLFTLIRLGAPAGASVQNHDRKTLDMVAEFFDHVEGRRSIAVPGALEEAAVRYRNAIPATAMSRGFQKRHI